MPEALESYLGYYIYFWIGDNLEPVHVHVAKTQQPGATKFWVTTESVEIAKDTGSVDSRDMNKTFGSSPVSVGENLVSTVSQAA